KHRYSSSRSRPRKATGRRDAGSRSSTRSERVRCRPARRRSQTEPLQSSVGEPHGLNNLVEHRLGDVHVAVGSDQKKKESSAWALGGDENEFFVDALKWRRTLQPGGEGLGVAQAEAARLAADAEIGIALLKL